MLHWLFSKNTTDMNNTNINQAEGIYKNVPFIYI